ncbi:Cysteine peptidase, asparagine active site-containing protein [Cynara cardunculus var. scolymus]|uniref:Cysteine peptidase, asparagine active site-containing protein n=1 Tax=Cynara cardunculus var. scolymus TaxID=59895 RepID=A0A103XUB2_CYNCS|nr:Cysteine peptidase, asparagine active site-containing protein [Cynara cardunculus var. scolymus]
MGNSKTLHTLLFSIILVSSQIATLSFPIEISILHDQETEASSGEEVLELFQKWKEIHGKTYEHAQEEESRLVNFRRSLKYVLEKNSKRKSEKEHMVGLNKFADLSNEEFKETYLSKVKGSNSNKLKMKGDGIKKNTTAGSCWAFSVVGAIESAHALDTGELIRLSEQELVDCDNYDYGCNGGNMDTAFRWVIKNGGIDTEADYPYTSGNGYDGKCIVSKENNIVVSIDSYTDVEPNENALLCAVAKQPVTVGIVGSAYDFQLYTGGIYDGECSSSPYDIDHAVLVVGYGSQDGEDYWIVKNSWGTYWGMDGWILMKRNTNIKNGVCGINLEPSYPHSSAPPPPSPPSPPSPPPPPPSPSSKCGDSYYCAAGQTCCCIFEFYNYCLIYGCCGYSNAVCCKGSSYCCPNDYPICDIYDGYCFKKSGDSVGVAAKKREMAKRRMPWEKIEETLVEEDLALRWK